MRSDCSCAPPRRGATPIVRPEISAASRRITRYPRTYVVNQWKALNRYVEDGRLPIDNTMVERALRGIATGRKNFLFAGSDAGAERAATIYTLLATCKLNGVSPFAYIADVLRKLEMERFPKSRLHELLPPIWRETAPDSAKIATSR